MHQPMKTSSVILFKAQQCFITTYQVQFRVKHDFHFRHQCYMFDTHQTSYNTQMSSDSIVGLSETIPWIISWKLLRCLFCSYSFGWSFTYPTPQIFNFNESRKK